MNKNALNVDDRGCSKNTVSRWKLAKWLKKEWAVPTEGLLESVPVLTRGGVCQVTPQHTRPSHCSGDSSTKHLPVSSTSQRCGQGPGRWPRCLIHFLRMLTTWPYILTETKVFIWGLPADSSLCRQGIEHKRHGGYFQDAWNLTLFWW